MGLKLSLFAMGIEACRPAFPTELLLNSGSGGNRDRQIEHRWHTGHGIQAPSGVEQAETP